MAGNFCSGATSTAISSRWLSDGATMDGGVWWGLQGFPEVLLLACKQPKSDGHVGDIGAVPTSSAISSIGKCGGGVSNYCCCGGSSLPMSARPPESGESAGLPQSADSGGCPLALPVSVGCPLSMLANDELLLPWFQSIVCATVDSAGWCPLELADWGRSRGSFGTHRVAATWWRPRGGSDIRC